LRIETGTSSDFQTTTVTDSGIRVIGRRTAQTEGKILSPDFQNTVHQTSQGIHAADFAEEILY
jgi:hypothetical protein